MRLLCGRTSPLPASRRDFLTGTAAGFGMLGLESLLVRDGFVSAGGVALADDSLPALPSPRESAAGRLAPHHPPRARAVIQLFMLGGASQLDTFDHKPEVIKRHGETVNFVVYRRHSGESRSSAEKSLDLGATRRKRSLGDQRAPQHRPACR